MNTNFAAYQSDAGWARNPASTSGQQVDAFGRVLRPGEENDASIAVRGPYENVPGSLKDRSGPPPKVWMSPEERAQEMQRIEARIERERPCRTLFVRNVKYTTESSVLREQFEAYGEIKSFFDLLSTRGMVFITYFDVRAASLAKEKLQGFQVGNRPIDVHYSLPKEEEQQGRCTAEKNQGSLYVRIKDAKQLFNDQQFRIKFASFGDLRSINHPPGSPPNDRLVEFYDSRATAEAMKVVQGTDFIGGTFDMDWAWDESTLSGFNDDQKPPARGGRGNRGRGRGRHDHDERGHQRGRDFGRSPPPRDDYRHDPYSRARSPPGRRDYDRYMPAPPPIAQQAGYGDPNQFEEARRVQALLSSLLPGMQQQQPSSMLGQSMQQQAPLPPQQQHYSYGIPQQSNYQPYNQPAPMPYNNLPPPQMPSYSLPPQMPQMQQQQAPAPQNSLPPAVLALLNSTQQQQQQAPPQSSIAPQQNQTPAHGQGDPSSQVSAILQMLQAAQQRK